MAYRVVFFGKWATYRDEINHVHVLADDSIALIDCMNWVITVPKGFTHDFATKPIYKLGDWDEPAILHDYMYANRPFKPTGGRITRKEADDIFYGGMLSHKVPEWRAWLYYKTVRALGWIYWNRHNEEFVG